MKYQKPFISLQQQIDKLKGRGLIIKDDGYAFNVLSTTSYYRLRAYTYPFQENEKDNQPFKQAVTLEQIMELYEFDSSLRKTVFKALEKIEIALRTQIVYRFAEAYGSHWQMDPHAVRDTAKFATHLESLTKEIERSNETFIKHYKEKYNDPTQPPSWMSLEVASFGLLSKIFQNLKKGNEKNEIAKFFGLKRIKDLENWMFCLSNLRNICAHHCRIWNKRLTGLPTLPYNTIQPFLTKEETETIYPNKLYAILCCMAYLLRNINEKSYRIFFTDLKKIFKDCPLKQEKEMGFPENWKQQTIWKEKQ
jgi:abortive infection bacteriophage resistance protein